MVSNKKRRLRNPSQSSIRPVFLLILAIILSASAIVCSVLSVNNKYSFTYTHTLSNGIYNEFWEAANTNDDIYKIAQTESETEPPPFKYSEAFGEILYSQKAYLVRTDGVVFLNQNGDDQFYPASLTKVMSAIVVYENMKSIDDMVTIDQDIIDTCTREGAAIAGFSAGESATVQDLMYGMLLPSGADCALGLAKYIAGSEEAFAEMMNAKAKEMGLKKSHFTNCTGLHDGKHCSSARDMAQIMLYALKIDMLKEIMSTYTYSAMSGTMHPEGIWMVSSVQRTFRNNKVDMGNIKGGKTGYTVAAGLCLATFGTKIVKGEPRTYVLVTMGAGNGSNDIPYHIYEAYNVFNSIDTTTKTSETTVETP